MTVIFSSSIHAKLSDDAMYCHALRRQASYLELLYCQIYVVCSCYVSVEPYFLHSVYLRFQFTKANIYRSISKRIAGSISIPAYSIIIVSATVKESDRRDDRK